MKFKQNGLTICRSNEVPIILTIFHHLRYIVLSFALTRALSLIIKYYFSNVAEITAVAIENTDR